MTGRFFVINLKNNFFLLYNEAYDTMKLPKKGRDEAMKKITALILALCSFITFTHIGFAEEAMCQGYPVAERFVKVKIPFPDTIKSNDSWRTVARFCDTKDPISLSTYYNGYIYATIPTEDKDREIEAFVPEKIAFTDLNPGMYEAFDMEWVSRTGVIVGNDKGEARPYDNVTRAEAVSMVMRFMGLDNLPEANAIANFNDVNKNDWFYPTVMSAYKCGIIKGDSETTFSPNRNVTREEVTVMVTNAIAYANLRCSKRTVENIADKDAVSEWAKEAYELIGECYISDIDDTDAERPVRILNPQKEATRYEVAYILNHLDSACQLYASDLAVEYGFDKEMPVIDGSTSTYPFTRAVYGQLFYNGYAHKMYPEKHSKSHASYQRLINGEVDMIFASVYPASDILEMAKEKGVEIELIPIAYDAMIFFTNKDNEIDGLTKEQISNIYVNDAYDNWSEVGGPDALMYPYCRNNDSGSHAQMEKHFLNGNEINKEVQRETSETMSDILTDVMAAKTEDPKGFGLGYSIYYYYNNMNMFYDVHSNLKLLAIDGVAPTDETIADGTYPLSSNTYIALLKDTPEDAPARRMAEFMLTEAGQVCVELAGFGKLKKTVELSDDMLFTDKLNAHMPEDKNYMFSPISIKMALALAANGASGETQEQILNAMGVSNLNEFNSLSKDLIERYSKTDILNLNIANSIWINKDKTWQNFSNSYKNTVAEFYDADVNSVDDENAVEKINSWVNDKTNEKIPTIIQNADDFWSMLINAIYFKGAWRDEFSTSATKPDLFNNADGTQITADFMNKTSWMPYAETKSVKMIYLPYQNRVEKFSEEGEYLDTESYDDLDVSMYLIMAEGDINVEQELSAAINDNAFESKYIKMSMPKFKIEYSTGLNDMFKNMGITNAFDSEKADFYKMFDNGNMWFTNTIHKTFINVDEKGTEAAAITAIAMAGSSLPPEPMELKFNKPFYFVIRDNTSGETLFMGRYAFAY